MNTDRTQEFLAENGIAMLVADKTKPAPEVDQLLRELGNNAGAIPFYAIYPSDGRPPIVFNDVPLLQKKILRLLQSAVSPSEVIVSSEESPRSSAL